jgi:hypothetical protein
MRGATRVEPAPLTVADAGEVHDPVVLDELPEDLNHPAAYPAPKMMTMTTTTAITA